MGLELTFDRGAVMVFGATGGIGSVVAREFGKAGVPVAAMWRSKGDAADALVEEIGDASAHQCDVTDHASLRSAIDQAIERHGRIHTVVWGAGPLVEQVDASQASSEQWRNAVATEVHGFFDAASILVPHMREQGGGSFVHLGSAGDRLFPPKDVLSVAPKAANESLIRAFAREEGVHNIRANSVLVGVIEAGMFLELTKQGVFDENWVREVQKGLGLKRWGQPEEIAHAAIYLASKQASYVTGEQISVSGGYGI